MKTKNVTTIQLPNYGGITVEFDNDKLSKEQQDKIIREFKFWLNQAESEQPTTLTNHE